MELQATREQLEKEILSDPTNLDTMLALAKSYLEEHSPLKARPLLEQVLEIDPENALAYLNLGLCWGICILKEIPASELWGKDIDDEEMIEKSIDALEWAIELDPEMVLAYNTLARIYIARGQENEAIEIYKQSIIIDQGQVDILEALQGLTGKPLWEIQGRDTYVGTDEDDF